MRLIPLSLLTLSLAVSSAGQDARNGNNLVGIDQFGRAFGTVDGFREDRSVGLFYWLWIGQPYAPDIYDASKIFALENGAQIISRRNCPESPKGKAHYWGEPLWGYYNSADEWVIRKQMEMITLAGVDFIYFDHTNNKFYFEQMRKVCKVLQEMKREGWETPGVVSYLHSRSFDSLRTLYETIYRKGLYSDVWYRIDGKPLVIAYLDPEDDLAEAATRNDKDYVPGELSDEIRNFFHFFKPNWPFDPVYEDGFPWVEWTFPQPYHSLSRSMSVSVASHPGCPMSFSLTRPDWTNWGRGWDPDRQVNVSDDVDRGSFFQRQWDEAIKRDPAIVSVGGWNEWIAYKCEWQGEYKLVDAANKEYSRDIEPMKGGYGDAFYLQLIANIRRYKGVRGAGAEACAPLSIDIDGPLSQWDETSFHEFKADSRQMARSCYGGAKTVHYRQAAPRNRLSEVAVAHDADSIYIMVKADGAWSKPDGNDWFNLYIGRDEPSVKGWEGYEYLVGTKVEGGLLSVDSLDSGKRLSHLGNARFVRRGNAVQIAISRKLLALDNAGAFYFKVCSGVTGSSDIMDSYTSGSAMPMGRLSYQYRLQ